MNRIRHEVEQHLGNIGIRAWQDIAVFAPMAEKLLRRVASDPLVFRRLVDEARADPDLRLACETNPSLSKIVVADDPATGARLRIHFFQVLTEAATHDHRWPFATLILRGGYEHTISVLSGEEGGGQTQLVLCQRHEGAGSAYSLSPPAYHRTLPTSETISLMLRGPAIRQTWSRVAADTPCDAERLGGGRTSAQRQACMSDETFQVCYDKLVSNGVI